MRGAAGADHQPAAAGRAGEPRRQRLSGAAHDDSRRHPRGDLNLVVEQHGPFGVGIWGGVGDQLRRLPGLLQVDRARGVLEDRSQLHELGDERAQPARCRQSRRSERHGDPRARDGDCERLEVGRGCGLVADVHECVRVIAGGGEEPRLHCAACADSLDSAGALGQPHVPEAAAEQPALSSAGRLYAERAEAPVDQFGVDALAVVGAAQLVAPAQQRRRAQRSHPCAPRGQELRVGCREREHDPARCAA